MRAVAIGFPKLVLSDGLWGPAGLVLRVLSWRGNGEGGRRRGNMSFDKETTEMGVETT